MKNPIRLLPVIVCLFVLTAFTPALRAQEDAPEEVWKRHMADAAAALKGNLFQDAMVSLQSALEVAERFGPDDPRLANTLNLMATFMSSQGRFVEATTLSRRSLAIRERALGKNHPEVAAALDSLAALYRDQGSIRRGRIPAAPLARDPATGLRRKSPGSRCQHQPAGDGLLTRRASRSGWSRS